MKNDSRGDAQFYKFFLRKKADREEEGQVLNLGEFDARITLLQIWNM